jgi:hypothetical protein
MTTPVRSTIRAARLDRRAAAAVAAMAALVCCASCTRSLRNPFSSMGPPAPDVLAPAASLDQVMAAVNANAQKVHTLHTNNASINVPGALGIPTLRGNIAVMRPGRMRLEASTAVTGAEVDFGSNDELFWFWVRRNEPPAIFFSRHAQRPGSAAGQLMPIDPQWLLDAMGLAEFRPTDRHEGPLPIDKNRVEITSYVQTASGPLVKRTVVDASKALVLEQHLYDGAGKPVASAIAKSHRYFAEAGAALPQVVEINMPAAELAMTIDLGTVEVNRLADNAQLWTMPVKPGYPAIDLGVQPPADPGGGAPAMGAQISGANWYEAPPVASAPQPMVGAPQPVVAASAVAASGPQFVPPGGVVAQTTTAIPAYGSPPGTPTAQRLPAGGVATSTWVR